MRCPRRCRYGRQEARCSPSPFYLENEPRRWGRGSKMEVGGQFHNNQPMTGAFRCIVDDMERRRREDPWRKQINSHFSLLFRPSGPPGHGKWCKIPLFWTHIDSKARTTAPNVSVWSVGEVTLKERGGLVLSSLRSARSELSAWCYAYFVSKKLVEAFV